MLNTKPSRLDQNYGLRPRYRDFNIYDNIVMYVMNVCRVSKNKITAKYIPYPQTILITNRKKIVETIVIKQISHHALTCLCITL